MVSTSLSCLIRVIVGMEGEVRLTTLSPRRNDSWAGSFSSPRSPLAEVTYTAGDIGYQVQESVRRATYTVQAKQENVSGVVLPAFEGVKSKDGSGELATSRSSTRDP